MKKIFLCLLVFCLFLTGCSNKDTNIDEEKFNIVTSFYPMYIATSNIVDGVESVDLQNMADVQVGCLHDYQMTTKDMNKLEKADVFAVNNIDEESFLDKATSAYDDLTIIDSSKGILQSENHDGHSHEENTHVWVSIDLYIKQVENIANELARIDEKNSDKYLSNKDVYIDRLENLQEEMHEKLDFVENKNIVTFHSSFEYFAEEFDLNVIAVIEKEHGTSPSAGELAGIIDLIKENDVKAIFIEPQYENTVADVISRETGIQVYTLNSAVSGALDKGEYEKIMRENLLVLEEALK